MWFLRYSLTAVSTFSALTVAADSRANVPANPRAALPAEGSTGAVAERPRPGPVGNAGDSVQPIAHSVPVEKVPVEKQTSSRSQPRATPDPVARWYGGQTLLVDGSSMALFILGLSMLPSEDGTAVASLGLVGYGLGAPVVHLAHGRGWRALGSLMLRGGLPLTFGVIGANMEDCSPDASGDFTCGGAGAALGWLAGIGTAIALDAALLANEPEPAPAQHVPTVGFFSDGRRTLVTTGGRF